MTLFAGSDIVSLIGQVLTLGGVLIVGRWAYTAKQDSKETLIQVANDHDSNLRDDVTQIIDTQKKHGKQIAAVDAKVDASAALLTQGWQINRDDIDELMNTEQRSKLRERLEWGKPSARREWRERNGYQPADP